MSYTIAAIIERAQQLFIVANIFLFFIFCLIYHFQQARLDAFDAQIEMALKKIINDHNSSLRFNI